MNKEVFEKIDIVIENNHINDDEVKNLVNKLKELDTRYINETQNRLEIIFEIRNIINILYKLAPVLKYDLVKLEIFYAYRDKFIDNYDKVMDLILNLANKDENNYSMKKVYATKIVDPNDKDATWYGKTLIILDKRVATILDKYKYQCEELGRLIKSIIEYGCSIVMITQNFCDGQVRPKESLFDDIEYKRIRNGGLAGDIACFLYDGKLKEAVDILIEYINNYGPDFTNINLDDLTNMVLDYSKNKKISKTR